MAAQNEVITVATTRDGNLTQQLPIVDESAIYRPFQNMRALSVFNFLMKKGSGRQIGDQKILTFNELPFARYVTVTVAASAGDVSLTVDNSTFCRKNTTLAHLGTQNIDVDQDPSSATSVHVVALAADVPAGTVLQNDGRNIGEGFVRQTPIARATNYHYDYVSNKASAYCYTNFLKARDYYVEREYVRIQRQAWEEFELDCGYELMNSDANNGTSSGKFRTNGLIHQGLDTNYTYCASGVLTSDMIDQAGYTLSTRGNARGDLDVIVPWKLRASASRAVLDSGYGRYNDPSNPSLGVKLLSRANSVAPDISGYSLQTDLTLSMAPWNRIVLVVNWNAIEAISNLPSMVMERIGDPGSDLQDGYTQMMRSLGFRYNIANGAVYMFDNVGAIRL